MTLEDKIRRIEQSEHIGQVNHAEILPEPQTEDGYYFVYYPDSLYKQAYIDILRYMASNVRIWYDRKLEHGTSWQQDVLDKASDYNCIGALIYLNEQALTDPMLAQVCRRLNLYHKKFFSVNYCSLNGNPISGAAAAEQMREQISERDLRLYKKCFANEKTYVIGDSVIDEKVRALKAIHKPDILEYAICNDEAIVVSVRDMFADRIDIPSQIEQDGKRYPVTAIGAFAFANCMYIREITFPPTLREIGGYSEDADRFPLDGYSFYRCKALRKIELPQATEIVHDHVFDGCVGLRTLRMTGAQKVSPQFLGDESNLRNLYVGPNVRRLGEVFYCAGMAEPLYLPCDCTIEGYAEAMGEDGVFRLEEQGDFFDLLEDNHELKSLFIDREIELRTDEQGDAVISLNGCDNLREIVFENSGENCTMLHMFCEGCGQLEHVVFPQTVQGIGLDGFKECTSLTELEIPATCRTLTCTQLTPRLRRKLKKMLRKQMRQYDKLMRRHPEREDAIMQEAEQYIAQIERYEQTLAVQTITFGSAAALHNRATQWTKPSVEEMPTQAEYEQQMQELAEMTLEQTDPSDRPRMGRLRVWLLRMWARRAYKREAKRRKREVSQLTTQDDTVVRADTIAQAMPQLTTIYLATNEPMTIAGFAEATSDRAGYRCYKRTA